MTLLAQAAGQAAQSGAAEFWVFWLLAPISLGAALAMVLLRNPVHGALMLVVNFFTIAVFYAVLEAQFLAVIQVIVYAGAIMILFLFVLMLLGVDRETDYAPDRIRGQRTAALLLGVVLLVGLVGAVAGPYLGTDAACTANPAVTAARDDAGAQARPCEGLAAVNAAEGGNPRGIGQLLFTDYVWPFEVTSVLLVIAAIGAMVLGRRREDPADLVEQGAAPTPAAVGAPTAAAEVEAGREQLVSDPMPASEGPRPEAEPPDGERPAGDEEERP